MKNSYCQNKQFGHPCFDAESHCSIGRIHLAVAPECNIKCRFCSRKHDCANENRPGVTSKIISPLEAIELIERTIKTDPRIKIAGIAGPGDPLANDSTFETFSLIKARFPELTKCLSTNGLLLPDRLDALLDVGLDTLSVTINAVNPGSAQKIYAWVKYKGQKYYSEEAARLLLVKQITGIESAVKHGLRVKVNTVLIPGVNDSEVPELASLLRGLGIRLMNIIPLIPQGEMVNFPAVSGKILNEVRDRCKEYINQFKHCKQCRADAIGIPGLEKVKVSVL